MAMKFFKLYFGESNLPTPEFTQRVSEAALGWGDLSGRNLLLV